MRFWELSENASDQEIRRAFRRLALKYHPDVNKDADAEDRFKEIYEAYQALLEITKPSRQKAERELTCDMCEGVGEIIAYWTSIPGGESMRCPQCLGSGRDAPPSRKGQSHSSELQVRGLQSSMDRMEETRADRVVARSGAVVAEAEELLDEFRAETE